MFFNEICLNGRSTSAGPVRIASALALISAICFSSGCARNREESAQRTRASESTNKDTLRRTEPADPFDLGAERKPTPDTMYALAKIMAARDRQTESMGTLRNIISQYPHYLPAYNALAEAYLQIGQSEDAIAILTEGLKRAPKDPVLLNNLGMARFLREEYADALPHFEKAADLRPEVPLYRANKAAALGMLGRSREARLEYRQILPANDADENVDILNRARRRSDATPVSAEPREAADPEQSLPPVASQP